MRAAPAAPDDATDDMIGRMAPFPSSSRPSPSYGFLPLHQWRPSRILRRRYPGRTRLTISALADEDRTDVINIAGLAPGGVTDELPKPRPASGASLERGVDMALSTQAVSVAIGQTAVCTVMVTDSGTVADDYLVTRMGLRRALRPLTRPGFTWR